MSSSSDQVEEIKTLIRSNTNRNKSLAYSALLQLHQQSADDPSSIQTLADNSQTLISSIAVDISDEDEEIAAQALKCLGFMIYHPGLVAAFSDNEAGMVLEGLARVVITTKIKSVCNLGVWCISMQQLEKSILVVHFDSVLRAVVHGLDNPLGSLSTTFEAIQAVMKLSAQLSEKMREFSHLWAPQVYIRLLSVDKRERDMSERCLLKIKCAILPPPAALSKAVVKDLKRKLLVGMEDLLNKGMKIQTLQAWGWFIRLLGSLAVKNRALINDMLRIPERTFSDPNPQVQIASQVAWEGLIDALIHLPVLICESDEAFESDLQQLLKFGGNSCQIQASQFQKSVKLIMTPLVGIILSKCDASVHSSCLNTWCYLLHKLDITVNHQSMIEIVLNPIFEAVFHIGPDTRSVWLWNLCLDLLDDFICAKCRNLNSESVCQVTPISSVRTLSSKIILKKYPINWSPWAVRQLDFFINMIIVIISHASTSTIDVESRTVACDAALRIFRSLLKGVQVELKSFSIKHKDVLLCLHTILGFIKKTCEDGNSEAGGSEELRLTSLLFLEAFIEELEPSVLGSPLYKMSLDLRYFENLQDIRCDRLLNVIPIGYMEMVSPLVYVICLYISVIIQLSTSTVRMEFVLQGMQKFFKVLLLKYDPLENLCVTIGLLYRYVGYRHLQIWISLSKCLKDCIERVEDFSLLKMEPGSACNPAICYLLSYPFIICSGCSQQLIPKEVTASLNESHVSPRSKLGLEDVTEVWKLLFAALSARCSAAISFFEELYSILNGYIDENISLVGDFAGLDLVQKDLNLLSLSGNAVTSVLEQILMGAFNSNEKGSIHAEVFSGINNTLGFAARFLKLSWAAEGSNPPTNLPVTSRVFSALANFADCLHSKQNVLLFVEIISGPLLQWLSHREIQDESTACKLQHLWAAILNCLKRSEPPIVFDSFFLKLQAPILERTLGHPRITISEITIAFWNSTYGEQIKLDYPESLLDILDRLSRSKRIILQKKILPFLVKCKAVTEGTSQRYKVTATQNRNSKRVEFVEDAGRSQLEQQDWLCSGLKRKRAELTEHQREVRRAQQGRGIDCSGHGPGIRTYSSVDFSQGCEDSQDSQEIHNSGSLLETLKKPA